ncbi:MAG: hypothetical protein ACE3K2_07840 [Paenibacillus sp.]
MQPVNRTQTQTIEVLENEYWDELNYASSSVTQVHQLRKKLSP